MHWFDRIPLGARYMILSALGFALMTTFVKLTYTAGLPVLEIVAARALISLGLSYLDVKRKRLSVWGQQRGWLLARGMVGALALICVYYAVTQLPLAVATVLQYLHPMFTAVIALLFLKERLHPGTIVGIALSFLGLIIMVNPALLLQAASEPFPPLAMAAAVTGALGSAVAYVIVRKLSQTEDASVIIFYFPLVALPFSVILLGDGFVLPQGEEWFLLLMVGIFTQIGQIGLTKAMQTETAARAAGFSYLQVVFAALLGWFVFAEIPGIATWAGGGLILAGALVNLIGKPRDKKV